MRNTNCEHRNDSASNTGSYDVIVIGGGNAAVCAAIGASEQGARVLMLEGAPEYMRGGNTRHTRNIRCAHNAADEFFTGPYPAEEYLDDLIQVTGGLVG
jgi:tricarballylate dehydrogenase